MTKIGIFFGSNSGTTEDAAKNIAHALKNKGLEPIVKDIASATKDDITKYDNIIFGTSTWGMGDLQDDWESFLTTLSDIDFNGRKVAIFGTGDQSGYPDTFVDGMGVILENIKGADLIAPWSTDGYDFSASKAVENGQFIGLVLDEDNQGNLSEERIDKWSALIAASL